MPPDLSFREALTLALDNIRVAYREGRKFLESGQPGTAMMRWNYVYDQCGQFLTAYHIEDYRLKREIGEFRKATGEYIVKILQESPNLLAEASFHELLLQVKSSLGLEAKLRTQTGHSNRPYNFLDAVVDGQRQWYAATTARAISAAAFWTAVWFAPMLAFSSYSSQKRLQNKG